MVVSEKRWMAVRFLSVLANSLVLALSLRTSAFLLAWWVLYKPQHQPHDFCDPGWQRWRSEGDASTCFFNSAIPQFLSTQCHHPAGVSTVSKHETRIKLRLWCEIWDMRCEVSIDVLLFPTSHIPHPTSIALDLFRGSRCCPRCLVLSV